MKIVTLITRLVRGGAQRIALETVSFLRDRGQDAVLWIGPQSGPEGSLLDEARGRGVPVRIFPSLVRPADPVRDFLALRALAAALREERPDWLHTHSSKAGILGREAARRTGVPHTAHTVHGWGFTPSTPAPVRRLYVGLERHAAGTGSRLLFVSEADRLEGVALGILGPGAGTLLPPGIDLRPFQDVAALRERGLRIRAQHGIDAGTRLVLFLGRMSPQKDPAAALGVMARIAAEEPAVRFVMAGDGPLAASLRAHSAAAPALAGRLTWTGLLADPVPWLAAADLLLLPSRWEGAPLTVLEAMAAGTPVLASALPGIAGLLGPPGDRWGVTVRPGDADAMAEAATALLRDAAARDRMAERARAEALSRHGLEAMCARLLEIYSADA